MGFASKLLNRMGYVKKSTAKRKIEAAEKKCSKVLDENIMLKMQIENLMDQVLRLEQARNVLIADKKSSDRRLLLAEEVMKNKHFGKVFSSVEE